MTFREHSSMKITVNQLRKIINEEVRRMLSEDIDSEADYAKFLEGKQYIRLWKFLVSKVPGIDKLKAEARNYDDFFFNVRDVYPGALPDLLFTYFENKSLTADQVEEKYNAYEALEGVFKTQNVTSMQDAVYGRSSSQVVDTRTGQPVRGSSHTTKGGSLGT